MLEKSFVAMLLFLAACTATPTPSQNAETFVPTPSSAHAVTSQTPPADRCKHDPPANRAAHGSAYLAVAGVGILRIAVDGNVERVVSSVKGSGIEDALVLDMEVAPDRALWLAYLGVGVARLVGDKLDAPAIDPQNPEAYYTHLASNERGVWAASSDIEWRLVQHTGKALKHVGDRATFPGGFEDNQLTGIAVAHDDLWVGCSNGLWRRTAANWRRIAAPPEVGENDMPGELFVSGGQLIVHYEQGYFLRAGDGWRRLRWSSSERRIWDVNEERLAVGVGADQRHLISEALSGKACVVRSEAVRGSIHDVALDGLGRAWVATDFVLAVIDRDGRLLAEWEPGALAGLDGPVRRIVVQGSGPARLPLPRTVKTRDLVGRVQVSGSSPPLSGAAIALCTSGADAGCNDSAFVRRGKTGPDGSFRLSAVPSGEFTLHVDVPPTSCRGGSRPRQHVVNLPSDCKGPSERTCDLDVLSACVTFCSPHVR